MTDKQQLINLFLGKDPDRTALHHPFEINGKVYATNANILIRCDRSAIDFEFKQPKKHPDAEAVIPKRNVDYGINLDEVAFGDYANKFCEDCNGTGTVRWKYKEHEKTDTCPECDGSGSNDWGKVLLRIGNTYIHIELAYLLQRVRNHEKKEIRLVRIGTPGQALLFEIGDFEVLVMPVWTSDDAMDKKDWHIIDIDTTL